MLLVCSCKKKFHSFSVYGTVIKWNFACPQWKIRLITVPKFHHLMLADAAGDLTTIVVVFLLLSARLLLDVIHTEVFLCVP